MNYYTLKSQNNNHYIYSGYHKLFLLSNSLLNKIVEDYRQGYAPKHIDGLEIKNIHFDIGKYDKNEVAYNVNFFIYLKNNNFFKKKTEKNEGKITPSLIKQKIANISRVVFEVTNYCNLDCYYCTYGELYDDYDERNNSNISFEKAKRLLDYIFQAYRTNKNVSSCSKLEIGFYGGEPFVNMNGITKIIEYVNENKPFLLDVIYTTTTNGTLLDKNMDFVVENNFRIWISIDGNLQNNKFRFYKNNKQETFSKVHQNIMLFKDTYPKYFDEKVDFQAVLHSGNSLFEIYDFVKKNYNKTPIISELSKVGIKKSHEQHFNSIFKDKRNEFSKITQCAILDDFFTSLPGIKTLSETIEKLTPFVVEYNELTKERKKEYVPTGTCIPFSIELFMTVSGKILPCEHIGQQFSLGSVTDTGVDIDYNKIAYKYESMFSKIETLCDKCECKLICTKCIYKLLDRDSKISTCNDFMDFNKFTNFLAEQISVMENNPSFYSRITQELVKKNI